MFISTDENDPIATLEAALVAVIAAEPIEQKIRTARKTSTLASASHEHDLASAVAQGIISKGELELVQHARALRRKAIMVDDFPKDLGKTEIYQTTQPVSFEGLKVQNINAKEESRGAKQS
jgi:acyl-CoA dehydrogenase